MRKFVSPHNIAMTNEIINYNNVSTMLRSSTKTLLVFLLMLMKAVAIWAALSVPHVTHFDICRPHWHHTIICPVVFHIRTYARTIDRTNICVVNSECRLQRPSNRPSPLCGHIPMSPLPIRLLHSYLLAFCVCISGSRSRFIIHHDNGRRWWCTRRPPARLINRIRNKTCFS